MRRLFIFFAMLLLTISANAQDDPTLFRISDETNINDVLRANIESNLFETFKSFQQAILTGKLVLPKKGITKDGANDIAALWSCSEFICNNMEVEERLLTLHDGGWEMRNVPVQMLADDSKNADKQLIISFDPKGNITGFDISIEEKEYNRLMAEGTGEQDLARRERIVNFIEIFRTAYNKKDLKYLEQVYSDDALIITGRVVKVQQKSALEQQKVYGEKIEYVKRDKRDYMNNLRKVFTNTRFINVKFSDISIVKHPKQPDVYGVTFRQDWTTQSYHDDGFVFLMIDFKDENHPEIHVRTWQPAVKNGKELTKDEIFKIGDFNL